MKKAIIICFAFLFVFIMGLSAQEKAPEVISPGIESGVAVVNDACPTFSWTAVPWAKSYRIIIFKSETEGIPKYEEMEFDGVAVLYKEITGQALSWTPSEAERLVDGEVFIWYVEAIDENGYGEWSEGKKFRVKELESVVSVLGKAREKLKDRGIRDVLDPNLLEGINAGEKKSSDSPGSQISITDEKNTAEIQDIEGEGDSNTLFGQQAGLGLSTGTGNTFIGRDAGRYTNSGWDNTFLGYYSGKGNTSGKYNTFLGYQSGYKNTTSSYNTYVGYDAGYNNLTGYYNTFLGYRAGYKTTIGESTFLGYRAGYENTTGASNTFVGYYAGYSNFQGFSNTYLGKEAGKTNQNGDKNTFIGHRAGQSNLADDNTFVGYQAGYHNTYGTRNTFVGYRGGDTNVSGDCNTMLGYLAGFALTGGDSNVFLGYKAGYSETGSNKLYIENSDSNSPLIWGDFENDIVTVNGKLALGTKTPGYTAEFDTTGVNCALVLKRTDGAINYINATSGFGNFGTVNDTPLRLTVNSWWRMRLDNDNSLTMKSGATCTAGGVWTDASSRDYKEDIVDLSTKEAMEALDELNPVKYRYKTDKEEEHLGFIAEDVPDLVAMKDRKGMSPMDVVAVLTKVVQEQQTALQEQQETLKKQEEMISELKTLIEELLNQK